MRTTSVWLERGAHIGDMADNSNHQEMGKRKKRRGDRVPSPWEGGPRSSHDTSRFVRERRPEKEWRAPTTGGGCG
jgi:hypothetical protein